MPCVQASQHVLQVEYVSSAPHEVSVQRDLFGGKTLACSGRSRPSSWEGRSPTQAMPGTLYLAEPLPCREDPCLY